MPGATESLTEFVVPFDAPLTEKAHVPPTATSTKVPCSPGFAGSTVAVAVGVAVGLLVATG